MSLDTRRRTAGLATALASAMMVLGVSGAHAETLPVVGWGERTPIGFGATALTPLVTPTPIPEAAGATAAAVGALNSFVLTPAGVLAAGKGWTGLGTPPQAGFRFTLIPGTAGAKAVAAGGDATLIAQADGTVLGFGRNGTGAAGGTPGTPIDLPTPIAGLDNVIAVSAGQGHSVALKADGSVWAWGENVSLGSTAAVAGPSTATPQRVALPTGEKATAISATGDGHSLALLEDGSVWGWGTNDYGQVGDGTTTSVIGDPVQVIAAPAAGAKRVTQISAGGWSSFALYDDGSFAAWGYGGAGELGLGNGGADVLVPTEPALAVKAARPDRYPRLKQISAIFETTFAIAADGVNAGRVLSWGSDDGVGKFGFGESPTVFDFAFPYDGTAGISGQVATEIPQRVSRLKGVPWLGVGASSSGGQLAPTDTTLRAAGSYQTGLPFFSQPVGTVSARKVGYFASVGDPTTVTKVRITGTNADDFEVVGYDDGEADNQTLPLTIGLPRAGDQTQLLVSVRFVPTEPGERFATLEVTGGGETAILPLSGFGAELPGNTPGEKGDDGAKGDTGVGAPGPKGDSVVGPQGPKGKDGVVSFTAKKAATTVKRGRAATLRFTLTNATSGWLARTTATASVPRALKASGRTSLTVIGLSAGKSRTVTLSLNVGKRAQLGTSTVRLRIPFGVKSITATAKVRVVR